MISEQRIADILRDQWNPIGCDEDLPRDEYASYAPEVRRILDRAVSLNDATARIASYLTFVRCVTIGLPRVEGCEKDALVAIAIVEAK